MAGWIKIHRDIQRHWIAQDMQKFGWWIDMLLLASYEDNEAFLGNKVTEVKRGQFIASLRFLAERWKVSKDKVNAFLKILTEHGMINRESDKNTTLITICKYESYQDFQDTSETPSRHLQDTSETPSRQTKEIQEIQEINNNISNAHTREEKPVWVGENERALLERFKAQGCSMAVARATGLKPAEINQLLDIFMAKCELSNKGHKDLEHFNNRFLWAIQNKKISLLKQEQPTQQKKVITNQDTYRLMQEMGWQSK